MKLVFAIDAIFPPLTGIGRYAFELATRLPKYTSIEELRYLGMWRWLPVLKDASATGPDVVSHPLVSALRRTVSRKVWGVEVFDRLSEPWRRHLLRGHGGAVFHSPNYFLPQCDGPAVATVHDLSIYRFPETHRIASRRYFDLAFERSLTRAAGLITDTEVVRQELIAEFSIPPDRITAIPLGVDAAFAPRTQSETEALLRLHGLWYGGYTLSVATLEPRKKLDALIKAFAALPKKLRNAYPLVLVGSPGWLNSEVQKLIDQGQAQGWLRYLGYVPQADLPSLYAGARGFAMISIYEGFGLPVLEAMASGVPVLTSDRSCLPEVAGGAALLVNPLDTDAVASQLTRLLTDDVWRPVGVARGLRRASELTWDRCVAQTVEVYRKVASA